MKHQLLAGLVGCAIAVPSVTLPARAEAPAPVLQTDLDEFMRQVLAKRDENWKKLQQYVLDEHERLDARGPTDAPLMGQRREYRWYIREGYFIRSPVTFDGVAVPEAERKKYEDDYFRRAKERDKRPEGEDRASTPQTAEARATEPLSPESLIVQTQRPEFVNSAYFLRFKFEQGKYALVGRERFDGRDVLRIEYYPARLFSRNQDAAGKPADKDAKDPPRDRRQDVEIERLMNKNSLVTLWVEPAAKQIVKYVFDNIQMDFLPISWLMRVDDLKASMTMGQPFKDVWLPKDVDMWLKLTFAFGPLSLHYHLDYKDYQEAKTSGRIRKDGGLR